MNPLNLISKVERNSEADLLPAERMNVVDRAITFFSPSYGVRAMIDRTRLHAFGYNDVPERRGKPPPLQGAETWSKNRDRLKMMSDARDLATFDWIGGVMAKVVLYVAGKLHCKSTTGEEQIDQAYDDYFHGWCGDERDENGTTRCDFSGRHRFLRQVQMAFLAFLVDGDHGFIEVDPQLSPTGEFCLQNIEADRIGSPMDSSTIENYIGGITVDLMTGRPQSYRIFRRTRTNQYVEPQEVPGESFIHIFDPDSSDEYRGRTKLLRLLNDCRDIREWIEAEKIAGKTQAQWAALIGTKDPFNSQGATAWKGKTDAGTPTQDAEWGKLLKLAEGENFSMLAPASRPSGAFMAFVETVVRKMAISIDLPFGFLWNMATLGGVTARIELQGALRKIQYWQDNILEGLILNRVRQKVIAQGIALGMLPPHPLWQKCEWHFGPWITTDAGYEMQNDIAGISTGIMPISEVTGKYGRSPREVFLSNATAGNEALSVGAELALPVEAFARGLFPDITNQKAAYLTPAPIPPPPAGSIEAIGDKGVAKLLELLEKVGDGTIDRESGIETAIRVFGLTRAQAEKIMPEEPDEATLNRAAGLSPEGKHAPVGPKIVVSGKKAPSSNGAKKPASSRK